MISNIIKGDGTDKTAGAFSLTAGMYCHAETRASFAFLDDAIELGINAEAEAGSPEAGSSSGCCSGCGAKCKSACCCAGDGDIPNTAFFRRQGEMVHKMRATAEQARNWDDGEWMVGKIKLTGSLANRVRKACDVAVDDDPNLLVFINAEPVVIRADEGQAAALMTISGHMEQFGLFAQYAMRMTTPSPSYRDRWQAAAHAVSRVLSKGEITTTAQLATQCALAAEYRKFYARQITEAKFSLDATALVEARERLPEKVRSFLYNVEARVSAATVAYWRLMAQVNDVSMATKSMKAKGGTSGSRDAIKSIASGFRSKGDEALFDKKEAALLASYAAEKPLSVDEFPAGYCASLVVLDCKSIVVELKVSPTTPAVIDGLVASTSSRPTLMLRLEAVPLAVRYRDVAQWGTDTRICVGDIQAINGAVGPGEYGERIAVAPGDRTGDAFTEALLGGKDPPRPSRQMKVNSASSAKGWLASIWKSRKGDGAVTATVLGEEKPHGVWGAPRGPAALAVRVFSSRSPTEPDVMDLTVGTEATVIYSPAYFVYWRRFADFIEATTMRFPLSATSRLRSKYASMTRSVDSSLKPSYWIYEVKLMGSAFLSAVSALTMPDSFSSLYVKLVGITLYLAKKVNEDPTKEPYLLGMKIPATEVSRPAGGTLSNCAVVMGGTIEIFSPIRGGLFDMCVDAATYGQAYTGGVLEALLNERAKGVREITMLSSEAGKRDLRVAEMRLEAALETVRRQRVRSECGMVSVGTQVEAQDILGVADLRLHELVIKQHRELVAMLGVFPSVSGSCGGSKCCGSKCCGGGDTMSDIVDEIDSAVGHASLEAAELLRPAPLASMVRI